MLQHQPSEHTHDLLLRHQHELLLLLLQISVPKDIHDLLFRQQHELLLLLQITMPKDNLHYGEVEHRDLHNLNGALVHMATAQGLVERGKSIFGSDGDRPFVLSRSFFAGSQRTGPIWTGDNAASWEHLRLSVPMLLSISIAGLPFAGEFMSFWCSHSCQSSVPVCLGNFSSFSALWACPLLGIRSEVETDTVECLFSQLKKSTCSFCLLVTMLVFIRCRVLFVQGEHQVLRTFLTCSFHFCVQPLCDCSLLSISITGLPFAMQPGCLSACSFLVLQSLCILRRYAIAV